MKQSTEDGVTIRKIGLRMTLSGLILGLQCLVLGFVPAIERNWQRVEKEQVTKSGEVMYSHVGDKATLNRLAELAVQRGEDRASFIARLNAYGLTRQDAALLFAWYREMPNMADHDDLLLAARVGDDDLVLKLLSQDMNPNSRTNDGVTPLIYAAMAKEGPTIHALLAAGADPTAKTKSGDSALLFVARRGDLAAAKILIEAGADLNDPNADGFTPLMAAARIGDPVLVRLFIENGANASGRNRDGWSPLTFGALGGSVEVGRLIIEAGADVNSQSWDEAWTPSLQAAENRQHGFMRFLIQNGADVDAKTKNGTTALILSAREDETDMTADLQAVEILLRSGANPNLADASGVTPLMIAARCEGSDLVRLLLQFGADPNVEDKSHRTALTNALQSSRRENADLLRAAGAKH